MKGSYRWFRVAAMVIMFVGGGSLIAMSNVAEATPLGAGDYALTSGDMTGSTFSIHPSGVFSAWNLTFPNPLGGWVTFVSLVPLPFTNVACCGFNIIDFNQGIVKYRLQTHDGLGYDYNDFCRDGSCRSSVGSGSLAPVVVPELSSRMLLAIGLLGLAGYRWQQRRREGLQVG